MKSEKQILGVGVCTVRARVQECSGVVTCYTFKFGFKTNNMDKEGIKKLCCNAIKQYIDDKKEAFGVSDGSKVSVTTSIKIMECDMFCTE